MNQQLQRFGAAMAAVQSELDWPRLGRGYCEGDGASFFGDELRARVLDTGLLLAEDVSRALAPGGAKRSLYVGAAVAELAPILTERLVLAREVEWLNLDCDETHELTRALRVVGERLGIELPIPSARSIESVAPASCDHLWLVSVLTDPDAFPALHDELYERAGGELATGRGDRASERRRADELADELLSRGSVPCVLSTTDEELEILRPCAQRRGLELVRPSAGRLTAIVGDRVRQWRVRRAS